LNSLGDCRVLNFCCCLNDVIYCVFAGTFLSALKSPGGNAAMLIF